MFTALTQGALQQIEVVETLIQVHGAAMQGKDSDTRQRIKLYAVSSCVTRLYAVYERFVEAVISDFLDAIPELTPFSALPEGFKREYRLGISHILSSLDSERYAHLSHENVVLRYHEALVDAKHYRFVTEALTRHDHNLRLDVVAALLSRIQLGRLSTWLSKSRYIRDLYDLDSAVYEQCQAEVQTFVQLRNDAAHGTLEDLEGRDNLLRLCAVVRALISAISCYLHSNLLSQRCSAGKARMIGSVTEVFQGPRAFVAQLSKAERIAKGMSLHMRDDGNCVISTVDSVQLNGIAVQEAVADRDQYEVGIKCEALPRRRMELYLDS